MSDPLRSLPGRIIRKLSRHPIWVVSVCSAGLRLGREAYRFKAGEIDAKELRLRSAGHVGSISGGAIGASVGAVAGSVLPGLGTIIGGFAGGMIGERGGAKLARVAAEKAEEIIEKNGTKPEPPFERTKREL